MAGLRTGRLLQPRVRAGVASGGGMGQPGEEVLPADGMDLPLASGVCSVQKPARNSCTAANPSGLTTYRWRVIFAKQDGCIQKRKED
jgi:hypothetical protein